MISITDFKSQIQKPSLTSVFNSLKQRDCHFNLVIAKTGKSIYSKKKYRITQKKLISATEHNTEDRQNRKKYKKMKKSHSKIKFKEIRA